MELVSIAPFSENSLLIYCYVINYFISLQLSFEHFVNEI